MADPAYLGEFEQLVLLSVLRAGQEDTSAASGAAVARELEEHAGRRVSRGALYTTLDRLEGKGLLRWKIATGGPERGACPAAPMRSRRAAWRRSASRSARCSACGAASSRS